MSCNLKTRLAQSAICLLGCAILTTFTGSALAQFAENQPDRLLREREEQQIRTRANEAEEGVKLGATPDLQPHVSGAPCFPIDAINVEGATQLSKQGVERLIAPYANSCMGLADIDNLLVTISQAYVAKGLITSRAYLPDQDIKSRKLHVVVVEGIVEDIAYAEVRGEVLTDGPKRKIKLALPIKQGELLQLRDIEQGVDQMNKLASANVQLDIAPGQQIGGSQLRLVNQIEDETRLTVRTNYDRSLGFTNKTVDVLFEQDDLLGLNEAWFVGYSGSNSSNSLSASLRVPYGYWDTSASLSYSDNAQVLTSSSLLYSPTLAASLSVDRLVKRSATRKLYVKTQADYSKLRRFINTSELNAQELVGFRTGVASEFFASGSYLLLEAGAKVGHQLEFAGKSPGAVHREFAIFDAQAVYRKGLNKNLALFAHLRGQYASSPLFSRDQLSLGGIASMRGLGGLSVSGEQGMTGTIELSIANPLGPEDLDWKSQFGKALQDVLITTRPSLFAEGGVVRNIASAQTDYGLSAGVSLSTRYNDLALSFYAATPVFRSKRLEDNHYQLGLTVSAKLF
ncbi:ShlB/FhaC/HecB family hemolysin secretion/activation protein [Pseudovibrio sp. POLY-S9]|uniref:ShlB/FhaC/HecB family hemolysin secretion/activation protein n=1 Tax=Pseudovibrio sp. POLY-S9 TaxID=1576596 RepID=UPI00070F03B8|nr:ShlB/FhaC/HecB family hemolysin secretion/activation protein [Pseudovibrio sp. POLY-S9]